MRAACTSPNGEKQRNAHEQGTQIESLAACLAVVGAVLAPAAGAGCLPGASVTRLGPVPGAHQLQLVLPLKANDAGLERLATAVSTPGSPRYGQFESMPTLARRFGASPATAAG